MPAHESQLPRRARAEISYELAGVTLSRLHGYWMVLTNPTHRYSRTERCNQNRPYRLMNWSRRCSCRYSPRRPDPTHQNPTKLVNQVLFPFSFSLLLDCLSDSSTNPIRQNCHTARCNRNRRHHPMNWSRHRCCCYSLIQQGHGPRIPTTLVNQEPFPFFFSFSAVAGTVRRCLHRQTEPSSFKFFTRG